MDNYVEVRGDVLILSAVQKTYYDEVSPPKTKVYMVDVFPVYWESKKRGKYIACKDVYELTDCKAIDITFNNPYNLTLNKKSNYKLTEDRAALDFKEYNLKQYRSADDPKDILKKYELIRSKLIK